MQLRVRNSSILICGACDLRGTSMERTLDQTKPGTRKDIARNTASNESSFIPKAPNKPYHLSGLSYTKTGVRPQHIHILLVRQPGEFAAEPGLDLFVHQACAEAVLAEEVDDAVFELAQ